MTFKRLAPTAICALLVLPLTGCLTQRTVSSGGQTSSQKIIVKRPVKSLMDNTRSY